MPPALLLQVREVRDGLPRLARVRGAQSRPADEGALGRAHDGHQPVRASVTEWLAYAGRGIEHLCLVAQRQQPLVCGQLDDGMADDARCLLVAGEGLWLAPRQPVVAGQRVEHGARLLLIGRLTPAVPRVQQPAIAQRRERAGVIGLAHRGREGLRLAPRRAAVGRAREAQVAVVHVSVGGDERPLRADAGGGMDVAADGIAEANQLRWLGTEADVKDSEQRRKKG